MRHAGKNVMVTGGASGLGEAVVRRLAGEGATVLVADVDGAAADRLAQALGGSRVEAVAFDVTDEAAWDQVPATFAARHGGALHALVNNAGIAPPGDLSMEFAQWRRVLSVNLDSVFLGTRAAFRVMRGQAARGAIINMSSVMAYVGQATTPAYSASKAGVVGLTKAAVAQAAAQGLNIRINTIHPGTHATPILEKALPLLPAGFEQQERARHPVGHFGDPVGVAATVSFLLQDEAEFYQGAEFVIDGGRLAVDR